MSDHLRIRKLIDEICNQFEEAWSETRGLEFASWLERIEPQHRGELLRSLLEIDVELRAKAGLSVKPEDYQALGTDVIAIVAELLKRDLTASDGANDVLAPTTNQDPLFVDSSSRQIGPYKLLQKIGEGGMGTVWMAEQEKPVRRRVALKVIKAGLDSKQVVARFEAERQALAIMDHNNIAKVFDGGTTDTGQPYFVMELVQGIPITQYCDQNKLSINERLELFVPICNAVQHAHQKGIIHRDLKPTNVLVCLYDGKPVPKVIDFGLAKALQHTTYLTDKTMFTEFGQVVGTLQYMSPEQAETNQLDIDTRTDIYSLGVMMYELLTGSTPIQQETLKQQAILKVLESIREQDPPRPSARLSSSSNEAISRISNQRRIDASKLKNILRGELDWIVMRALEKDRTRRYETATKLADDVNHFLNQEPVSARPPSVAYLVRKVARRHRLLFVSGACVLGAIISGLAVAIWFAIDANIAREKAEQISNRSNYFLALARWDSGRVDEANQLLDGIPPQYRNFEWHVARRDLDGSYITWPTKGAVDHLAMSLDGRVLLSSCEDMVFGDNTSTLQAWSFERGANLDINFPGFDSSTEFLCFESSGETIITGDKVGDLGNGGRKDYASAVELRRFAPSTGHIHSTVKTDWQVGYIYSAELSADGKQLAICNGPLVANSTDPKLSSPNSLHICDALTGATQHVLTSDDAYERALFTLDNIGLLIQQPQAISLFDLRSRKIVWTRKFDFGLDQIAIHPNGRWAGCASGNDFLLLSLHDGQDFKRHSLPDHPNYFAFTPDGSSVVFAVDQVIELRHAITGQLVRQFKGHRDQITVLQVTPDGSKIVSGSKDASIKVWEIEPTCALPISIALDLRFSKDDRYLETLTLTPGRGLGEFESWALDTRIKSRDGIKLKPIKVEPKGAIGLNFSQGKIGTSRSRDGRVFAHQFSWNDQTVIGVWDLLTGNCINSFAGKLATGNSVSLNADGNQLAAALSDTKQEANVTVWDIGPGRIKFQYRQRRTGFCSVCYSIDGKNLAIGRDDGIVTILDGSTAAELFSVSNVSFPNLDPPAVQFLRFHEPSGLLLAGCQNGTIALIDLWSRRVRHRFFDDSGEIITLTLSPDGTRLASGSESALKIWDVARGDELRSMPIPGVANLEFSADGSKLAVGCYGPSSVTIIDSRPPNDAALAARVLLNDRFYREHALATEKEENWFAAMFHWAWVMKSDPENAATFDSLHQALEQWLAQLETERKQILDAATDVVPKGESESDPITGDPTLFLPSVVREMLQLPRGKNRHASPE